MKKRHVLLLLLSALMFAVFACSLPNMSPTSQASPQQSAPPALTVQTDTSRGQGVLVTTSGAKIDIQSVGDDGTTATCVEPVGVAPVSDGSGALSMSAGSFAIVVGSRKDGGPGAWVYSSNKFESVIDEESGKLTSRLPESAEKDGIFRGQFGWVYHVQGVSEDGKIIVGFAENKKGINWGKIKVDPGTTLGVYWQVSRHHFRPFFMVSRAHIIGTPDAVKIKSAPKRVRHLITEVLKHGLNQLKFLLLDYFSSYLTMVDKNGVHLDTSTNLYNVTGTDQDKELAVATIDAKGNITITETPPPPPPPPMNSSIYVAGSYNAPNNIACYWRVQGQKTTKFDLDTSGMTPSYATGISVASDGTVYVSGYYYNSAAQTYVGAYWVNGVRTDLPGANGNVYSLFVSGGTIYTAGYYNDGTANVASYWVGNANPTKLLNSGSAAFSISVSGSTVYTAGYDGNNAAFWTSTGTNISETLLTNRAGAGQANSIYVNGGTVYVAGQDTNSGKASYWPGATTATDLTAAGGTANSIIFSGGTAYVAGQDGMNAAYWTNTTENPLESSGSSIANSIFLSGSTIYTAGQYGTSASYWTVDASGNIVRTDFVDANALATGIVVQ